MQEQWAKEEVIAAGNELVARGLVARTWGNVSCRIDEGRFAITPSGIGYERLSPGNIVVVDMHSLKHEGNIKPSSEKGIHAAAYRMDSNINCVVHTHQTYATCAGVAGYSSLSPSDAEAAALGGKIARAKYGLPGTKTLRKNVEKALFSGSSAILMEKHGALLTGADRRMAFERAVILENVCKRALRYTDLPDCVPTLIGRRRGGQAFEIQQAGREAQIISMQAEPAQPVEQLHAALYRKYPQFRTIMHFRSGAIDAALKAAETMPALLDDFAQMVGSNVKACPALPLRDARQAISGVLRNIRGRNCVYVEQLGAICCAETEDDCRALLTLTEKNALAYRNALHSGNIPVLSWADKKLMRFVYVRKYAKKK